MAVLRMGNVGIVVEDLDAAIGFFAGLGLAEDPRRGESRADPAGCGG